jgi:hypothetical protein
MLPNTIVISNCDILPIMVISTALILSAVDKQKTLPPYSPILFGVKAETVIPENTALNEVKIEIFSIFFIKNLHLSDSNNQLKNIKNTTIQIVNKFSERNSLDKKVFKL